MASGPSKQDLEMYWQSSRQYFDELAAYYKQADPEYYRAYMEPFYTNPLNAASISDSGPKGGSGAAKLLIVVVIFFFILGIGGVAAYFVIDKYSWDKTEETDEPEKQKDTKEREVTKEKDDTKNPKNDDSNSDDETSLSSDDHFIIGSKKIGEKDYDKAEYHLKQVKPGTQYYEQSKQLLESLKFLRKYDK